MWCDRARGWPGPSSPAVESRFQFGRGGAGGLGGGLDLFALDLRQAIRFAVQGGGRTDRPRQAIRDVQIRPALERQVSSEGAAMFIPFSVRQRSACTRARRPRPP